MDQFDDDPKIARLPVRGPTPALEYASAADVRKEVEKLLAEAEQEPTPPMVVHVPDSPKGPAPRHRNGRDCPQCDRWTWQATRECVHCNYDLFAHEHRLALERQSQWHSHRQQQLLRWSMGLIGCGLAAIYFSPNLPPALRSTAVIGGLIAVFVGLACGRILD